MKIAISGSTQNALELAQFFADQFAEVHLFGQQSDKQNFRSYPHQVKRVQKLFLNPNEEIQDKSRMVDTFRVVYEMSYEVSSDFDKEKMQQMNEEMKKSLEGQLEYFVDADIFIEADRGRPRLMGTGGPTIGEQNLINKIPLFYGFNCLEQNINDYRDIAIVGSGDVAAQFLVQNKDWLENEAHRAFIISTHGNPFEEVENEELRKQLDEVLGKEEAKLKERGDDFLSRLREWEKLEDYIKAKKPRPVEPIGQIIFFAAHNVTSINKLVDQQKFYLTCEIPSFREAKVQKDNAVLNLKTIGVDACFVMTGHELDLDKYSALRLEWKQGRYQSIEPGFFITDRRPIQVQCEEFFDEIKKYFSPA
jgi:hypothetical protein